MSWQCCYPHSHRSVGEPPHGNLYDVVVHDIELPGRDSKVRADQAPPHGPAAFGGGCVPASYPIIRPTWLRR